MFIGQTKTVWCRPARPGRSDGPNMYVGLWDRYRVSMSFSRSEFKFLFLGILDIKACKSVCLDLMYSAVAEELNFGLKYGSWRLNGLCAWPDATYIFLESAKY